MNKPVIGPRELWREMRPTGPNGHEFRAFPIREVRVTRSDSGPTKIAGHAAVFDQLSEDLGGWRERILPGAFAGALQNSDVRALINHDENSVLGRNKAGTLRLSEDAEGLAFECDLPDTTYARDLSVVMERGDMDQCSFAFIVDTADWSVEDGMDIRNVAKVRELFDVSVVTYPAYPQTDAVARFLSGIEIPALDAACLRSRAQNATADDTALIKRAIDTLSLLLPDDSSAMADELQRMRDELRQLMAI